MDVDLCMGFTLVNDADCQTGNMVEWQSLLRDGINREMALARAAVVGRPPPSSGAKLFKRELTRESLA
jgi:hypothetical protein